MSPQKQSCSQLHSAAQERRDLFFWILIAVLASGLAVLVGFPLTRVLPVVGVLVVANFIELLLALFGLPDELYGLFPGLALLALCVWVFATNGSLLLLAGFALAGGWILYDTIRSLTGLD